MRVAFSRFRVVWHSKSNVDASSEFLGVVSLSGPEMATTHNSALFSTQTRGLKTVDPDKKGGAPFALAALQNIQISFNPHNLHRGFEYGDGGI